MSRRLLAVVLGAVLAAVVAGAAALLLRSDGEDAALSTISAIARPVEMAVPDTSGPFAPDLTGEVSLFGEHKGLRFVQMAGDDGRFCWGVADRRFGDWGLTDYLCEAEMAPFPDAERPVLVVGRVSGDGGRLFEYLTFAGFATDAVKRVGVIDRNDRVVPVADVVGNVFYEPRPPRQFKRIVALDADGEIIWQGPEIPVPDE